MTPEEEEAIRREFEASRKQGHTSQSHQGPAKFQTNDHANIKHVIGVISGKGGVGKSLVTGILAIELQRAGHKVAILDGDITGPSIPKMFGLSDVRATGTNNMIIPAESASGIRMMSTNLVLENETDPVIWRGPVLGNALQQFYEETMWGDIDYLLVDMPPGTGDVALTVFQSLPIEGVVIVSTPQDLVQMVVGKAVNMAAMMDIPVIGLVENMAYFQCPDCGKRHELFGPSRAALTCAQYGIDMLGQLPIDPKIAEACDLGSIELALPQGVLADAVAIIEGHDKQA
ncbi:MAG: Mrp/NBP35 family ATP-binding protein [Atopobiaceae bacterium]|nr:Mrp/NBP35 family ATP-binding protein [Atopobiaceae bacterium]